MPGAAAPGISSFLCAARGFDPLDRPRYAGCRSWPSVPAKATPPVIPRPEAASMAGTVSTSAAGRRLRLLQCLQSFTGYGMADSASRAAHADHFFPLEERLRVMPESRQE